MESNIYRKRQNFKVSIRKQQIEKYLKSRRCELLQHHEQQQRLNEDENIYQNILNFTTFENLSNMNQQQLHHHLQMLIEITSSELNEKFMDRFEEVLKIMLDFFDQSNRLWFEKISSQIIEADEETKKIVTLNKLLSFFPAHLFIKYVGTTYFYIVPENLDLLRYAVSMLRQLLEFSMSSYENLSRLFQSIGFNEQKPVVISGSKFAILNTLMNITASQDPEIMKIVFEECVVQELERHLESYGFQQEQRQSIAGIYANMMEYLCSLVENSYNFQQQSSLYIERQKEYCLFLSIFEDLAKSLNNVYIWQRMVVVSIQLLQLVKNNQLECNEYILDIVEEMVRNILMNNQYIEYSQNLFINLVQVYNFHNFIDAPLQFLRLILNKHVYVYVKSKMTMKSQVGMMENHSDSIPLKRSLGNISKLIKSCSIFLKRAPQQYQKQIVQEVLDFWCREQLQEIKIEIMQFMTVSLTMNEELTLFCFQNSKISEAMVSIIDTSYQYIEQIQQAINLTYIFFSRMKELPNESRMQFISEVNSVFNQIRVRLQDYFNNLHKHKKQNEKQLRDMIEANISYIDDIFENSDTI